MTDKIKEAYQFTERKWKLLSDAQITCLDYSEDKKNSCGIS